MTCSPISAAQRKPERKEQTPGWPTKRTSEQAHRHLVFNRVPNALVECPQRSVCCASAWMSLRSFENAAADRAHPFAELEVGASLGRTKIRHEPGGIRTRIAFALLCAMSAPPCCQVLHDATGSQRGHRFPGASRTHAVCGGPCWPRAEFSEAFSGTRRTVTDGPPAGC